MSSTPRPIKRIFSSPTRTVFRRALYGVPMAMALAAFLLVGNTVLTRVSKGSEQLPQTLSQHIVSSSAHFQLADPLFTNPQAAGAGKTDPATSMTQEGQDVTSALKAKSVCTTATYQRLTARANVLLQQLSQSKLGVQIDPQALPTPLNEDALKNLDATTRSEIVELQSVMTQLQKTARC